jgi:hypothetical protein
MTNRTVRFDRGVVDAYDNDFSNLLMRGCR